MARWLLPLLLVVLFTACSSPAERRERVFAQVATALDSGDPGRALAILEATLAHDPRDAAIRAQMAEIKLDLGQAASALQTLEALPGDVIAQPEYTRLLARAMVAGRRPWQALPLVLALERQGKAEPELVNKLLRQLARSGEVEVDLPPTWRRRLFRRELAENRTAVALGSWRRLPEEDPQRAEFFDLLLEKALRQENDTLLVDLPELRELPASPFKLLARHRLAVIRGTVGAVAQIEEEFLEHFPDHPERYSMLLGTARRKVRGGQPAAGLELARSAAALAPERPEPLVEQGLALSILERPKEARQVFELVLAISPHNPVARQFLAKKQGTGAPVSIRFEATGVDDL